MTCLRRRAPGCPASSRFGGTDRRKWARGRRRSRPASGTCRPSRPGCWLLPGDQVHGGIAEPARVEADPYRDFLASGRDRGEPGAAVLRLLLVVTILVERVSPELTAVELAVERVAGEAGQIARRQE